MRVSAKCRAMRASQVSVAVDCGTEVLYQAAGRKNLCLAVSSICMQNLAKCAEVCVCFNRVFPVLKLRVSMLLHGQRDMCVGTIKD